MGVIENIRLALNAVRGNLLRSILTIMIIAVGITALVGILTAIDAAIYSFSSNFSSLGANTISIKPIGYDGPRRRGAKMGEPITYKEAVRFKEIYDYPSIVSIYAYGSSISVLKYNKEKTNPDVRIMGIDENYLGIQKMDIEVGRGFNASDVQNGGNRTIIGQDVVDVLFGGNPDRAIGKIISIGSLKYKVIGVLKSKGASMGRSQDRVAMVPLSNFKNYYGAAKTNYRLSITVKENRELVGAESTAIGMFRNIRKLKIAQENDFIISMSDGIVKFLKENTVKLRMSAIIIGLITLIGAAIGLMNIMMVSVTERTKEIGVVKALGATKRNILIQFLMEAMLICQVGGLVGIIFGVIIGNIVTIFLGGTFLIPWLWITIGIVLCMIVGLASGIYPAIKAANLDPIEALRYE